MRLLIVGTGPFAVPMLRDLASSQHEILGLITKPLDESARRKAPANPMRETARDLQLPILETVDINAPGFVVSVRRLAVDLMVVCDFGQILSAECLATTRLGAINLHGSLLPRYRGAAPIQRAVWAGEVETGVSVIHMSPRLDAGPVLASAATRIGAEETADELESRLAELGCGAVREALAKLSTWDCVSPLGQPQNSKRATRAPRISKDEGRLDWNRPATDLHNQIRAFQPWPGSFTELARTGSAPLRLIVHGARVVPMPPSEGAAEPGKVVAVDPAKLIAACGTDCLALERVQPAGKRAMEIAEFLRGNPVRAGDRFQ